MMGLLDEFTANFTDPERGRELQANPWFQMGLGLLQSRYNKNVNPFQAAQRGLAQAQQSQIAAKRLAHEESLRELAEKDRERKEELGRKVQGLIAPAAFAGHPGMQDMPGAELDPQQRQAAQLYSEMAAVDPEKALTGYLNFQQRDKQLQQTRNRSRGHITDAQGRMWIQDATAKGGVIPMTDPEGNQLMAQVGVSYEHVPGVGWVAVRDKLPADATAADAVQVVKTAEELQQAQGTIEDMKKQQGALRGLASLEAEFSKPGSSYNLVNQILSPEYADVRDLITGWSGMLGGGAAARFYPKGRDYLALQERMQSQAFVSSIQSLRATGATVGQITEKEGDKLQNAFLKITEAGTEEEFIARYEEFRGALASFIRTARREAGQDELMPYIEGGIDLRTDESKLEALEKVQEQRDTLDEKYRKKYGG